MRGLEDYIVYFILCVIGYLVGGCLGAVLCDSWSPSCWWGVVAMIVLIIMGNCGMMGSDIDFDFDDSI
jgi:uncharacterized membrane protein YkvI